MLGWYQEVSPIDFVSGLIDQGRLLGYKVSLVLSMRDGSTYLLDFPDGHGVESHEWAPTMTSLHLQPQLSKFISLNFSEPRR